MKFIATSCFVVMLFCGCTKDKSSCYDPSLVHNGACTADCPGVCGCDEKTYCNECEAHRAGVRVVHEGPCK